MNIVIKYDMWGAHNEGIDEHPYKVVEDLGMKVWGYEGAPIGDCAFMLVENLIDNLPKYIERSTYKLVNQ